MAKIKEITEKDGFSQGESSLDLPMRNYHVKLLHDSSKTYREITVQARGRNAAFEAAVRECKQGEIVLNFQPETQPQDVNTQEPDNQEEQV